MLVTFEKKQESQCTWIKVNMEMESESEVWVRGLVSSLYWTLQSIDIVGFMYMCASLGKDPAIFMYLDSLSSQCLITVYLS